MAKVHTYVEGVTVRIALPLREPRPSRTHRGYGPIIELLCEEFKTCLTGFRFSVNADPEIELLLVDGETVENLRTRAQECAAHLIAIGLADKPARNDGRVYRDRDAIAECARASARAEAVRHAAIDSAKTLIESLRYARPSQDQARTSALPR